LVLIPPERHTCTFVYVLKNNIELLNCYLLLSLLLLFQYVKELVLNFSVSHCKGIVKKRPLNDVELYSLPDTQHVISGLDCGYISVRLRLDRKKIRHKKSDLVMRSLQFKKVVL